MPTVACHPDDPLTALRAIECPKEEQQLPITSLVSTPKTKAKKECNCLKEAKKNWREGFPAFLPAKHPWATSRRYLNSHLLYRRSVFIICVAAFIFPTVLLISKIEDIQNVSHSITNKDLPFVRQGRVSRKWEGGRALSGLSFSLPVSYPRPL